MMKQLQTTTLVFPSISYSGRVVLGAHMISSESKDVVDAQAKGSEGCLEP